MRSLWKGAISFGLVNIPVRMYAATEDKSLSFNQLHRKCHTPIRYVKHCPTCDSEVRPEEIVRGYEYENRGYVILEEEDFADLPSPTLKAIEILDFIDLAEIDPIFYRRSYYLEPVEGAGKPYLLLLQAMQHSGKVALGKITVRARESLCCLRVYRDLLSVVTMHYPDEVRSIDALQPIQDRSEVTSGELRMALQLIESLSTPFEPDKYADEYRHALLRLIHSKAAGRQIHQAPSTAPLAEDVMDLMAALEASLRNIEKTREPEEEKDEAVQATKAANGRRRRS
ncbi:MAG: Ku protein [Limnochordia bacterium]|jgi:DNA end-binding protein Ku